MSSDRVRNEWLPSTYQALLVLTVGALLARLVFLGERVAHWDEGRVAYWILRYMETGDWSYSPILHGPFFVHVNEVIFGLVGPSDYSMRLIVAIVGGLAPLSAWLFRERLRNREMLALGFFLAANPILLYYSRFMRNDVLLAVFMIAALGCFVRLLDTHSPVYLYAGVGLVALAFTTKENVLVYLVSWLGAAALLLDHRLFVARDRGLDWAGELRIRTRNAAEDAWRWRGHLLLVFVEFLAIVVFFYAPRAAGSSGPGLEKVVANPGMFPAVVYEATVGSWMSFWGLWVGGSHQDHSYLPYLIDYLRTLEYGAVVLVALAVVGFVADRYRRDGPRDVVAFASYWGFVSILGYPFVTDIKAPWATVHAVAPLAIPAAIGFALLVRWGLEAYDDDDTIGVTLVALLVLILVGNVAATAVDAVYTDPASDENELVQYVQPEPEMRATLNAVHAAIEQPGNPDVLFYGERYGEDNWHDRLPLPWYLEQWDAERVVATNQSELESKRDGEWGGEIPAVVITHESDEDSIRPYLEDYERHERYMATHSKKVVIYVDTDRTDT